MTSEDEARAQAWAVYDEEMGLAEAAYHAALVPARVMYNEAAAQAWAAYDEARERAEAALKKALRQAKEAGR